MLETIVIVLETCLQSFIYTVHKLKSTLKNMKAKIQQNKFINTKTSIFNLTSLFTNIFTDYFNSTYLTIQCLHESYLLIYR